MPRLAFTKHWSKGDPITAERLNRMEEAIAAISAALLADGFIQMGGLIVSRPPERRPVIFEAILQNDLVRGGTSDNAKVVYWSVEGNNWVDTSERVKIRDVSRIPTGKKLTSGDQCSVSRKGRVFVLEGFDCNDLVSA